MFENYIKPSDSLIFFTGEINLLKGIDYCAKCLKNFHMKIVH